MARPMNENCLIRYQQTLLSHVLLVKSSNHPEPPSLCPHSSAPSLPALRPHRRLCQAGLPVPGPKQPPEPGGKKTLRPRFTEGPARPSWPEVCPVACLWSPERATSQQTLLHFSAAPVPTAVSGRAQTCNKRVTCAQFKGRSYYGKIRGCKINLRPDSCNYKACNCPSSFCAPCRIISASQLYGTPVADD